MRHFLRKLFFIDFFTSFVNADKPPHLRFAVFLNVFSYMWLVLGVGSCIALFNIIVEQKEIGNIISSLIGAAISVGFFFFYRHTSKILKTYSKEEASSFRYLRFINPVAPVIYVSTAFLLVIGMLNIVMAFLFLLGLLLYVLGIIVTLGLLLLDDSYKLSGFTSVPDDFFRAEKYFLNHIISPELLIIFLLFIYFIIPVGTSLFILIKHYSSAKELK